MEFRNFSLLHCKALKMQKSGTKCIFMNIISTSFIWQPVGNNVYNLMGHSIGIPVVKAGE